MGAEVVVAGVVEAVDAAFVVDGEKCGAVRVGGFAEFLAEWGDLGAKGAAEVGQGASPVEAAGWVDDQRGGGEVAAWRGGGELEAAELGPGFDGGGEDRVLVSAG